MKVYITRISTGKFKGDFRFKLVGNNGENIDPRQPYNSKQSVKKTVKKFFPGAEVVDTTLIKGTKKISK